MVEYVEEETLERTISEHIEYLRTVSRLSVIRFCMATKVKQKAYKEMLRTGDIGVNDLVRILNYSGYYLAIVPNGENIDINNVDELSERLRDKIRSKAMVDESLRRRMNKLTRIKKEIEEENSFLNQ